MVRGNVSQADTRYRHDKTGEGRTWPACDRAKHFIIAKENYTTFSVVMVVVLEVVVVVVVVYTPESGYSVFW